MIEGSTRRKILVPIFYRGHYGRLRPVLKAIQAHPKLELLVIVARQAAYDNFFTNIWHSEPPSWRSALPWYVRARLLGFLGTIWPYRNFDRDYVVRKMKHDGFPIHASPSFLIDGGVPATMAKSVGLGVMRIVDEMRRLNPDFVFINADRFEMMAVAIAAAYLNIPIVHNEAGDISGTIDESVRHAITKFAHVHLAATDASRERVLQMGEDPQYAFTVGSPAIDALRASNLVAEGVIGGTIDMRKPYLLVLHHPVTTETSEENLRALESVFGAVERCKLPTVVIGANSDAGSNIVGKMKAAWYATTKLSNVFFIKSVHPDRFYQLLRNAACAVGNSSSFLREGAYLGTPAVIVGSRQKNRDRRKNVIEVSRDASAIEAAIQKQLHHGRYPTDPFFGVGDTSIRIANILATVNPPIQKVFHSYPQR